MRSRNGKNQRRRKRLTNPIYTTLAAELYEKMERFNMARRVYKRVLKNKKASRDILANAYRKLGWLILYQKEENDIKRNDLKRAKKYFQMVTTLGVHSTLDACLLAYCNMYSDNVAETLAPIFLALDTNNDADLWFFIGCIFVNRRGEIFCAIQAFALACIINDHLLAWYYLALLYEGVDEYNSAYLCYTHIVCANTCMDNDLSDIASRKIEEITFKIISREKQCNLAVYDDLLPFGLDIIKYNRLFNTVTIRNMKNHYPNQSIENCFGTHLFEFYKEKFNVTCGSFFHFKILTEFWYSYIHSVVTNTYSDEELKVLFNYKIYVDIAGARNWYTKPMPSYHHERLDQLPQRIKTVDAFRILRRLKINHMMNKPFILSE